MDIAPERVMERIRRRIVVSGDGGCWAWPGALSKGYGRIGWTEDGQPRWASVHRLTYAAEFGPIAEGFDIDHLCHDPGDCQPERAELCPHRRCCNPTHLAAVSRRENLLRGGTIAATRAAVTHCPAGHAYAPENTITGTHGRRQCRECTRRRVNEYAARNRARKKEYNRAYYLKRKAEQ